MHPAIVLLLRQGFILEYEDGPRSYYSHYSHQARQVMLHFSESPDYPDAWSWSVWERTLMSPEYTKKDSGVIIGTLEESLERNFMEDRYDFEKRLLEGAS